MATSPDPNRHNNLVIVNAKTSKPMQIIPLRKICKIVNSLIINSDNSITSNFFKTPLTIHFWSHHPDGSNSGPNMAAKDCCVQELGKLVMAHT